jgi:hypothetical protein
VLAEHSLSVRVLLDLQEQLLAGHLVSMLVLEVLLEVLVVQSRLLLVQRGLVEQLMVEL